MPMSMQTRDSGRRGHTYAAREQGMPRPSDVRSCMILKATAWRQAGFTILELVVAIAVFSIVLGAAVSISQFQARKGAGSTVRKMANEAVALAIMQIRRDIVRAGFGLLDDQGTSGNPAVRLSVFVQNGSSGAPDELLLSFSDHIEMDIDATKQNSFFSMFTSTPHGSSDTTHSFVSWSLATQNLLQMPNVNTAIDATSIGGLITMTNTGTVGFIDSAHDSTWKVSPVSGTQNYNNKTQTLQMQWNTPFTGKVAPAICYLLNLAPASNITLQPVTPTLKDRQGDYTRGQLLRNGVPLIGGATGGSSTTASAMPPYIKVTDFQVRCGFYIDSSRDFSTYFADSTSIAGWTPDGGKTFGQTTGGLNYTAENLRVLEITLKYIIRDKGGGNLWPGEISTPGFNITSARTPDTQNDYTAGPWAIGGTYTVLISPRTLTLGKQLGANPYGS